MRQQQSLKLVIVGHGQQYGYDTVILCDHDRP
jgi:hypothetical protein